MLVHAAHAPESQEQKGGMQGQEDLRTLWKDPEGLGSKKEISDYAAETTVLHAVETEVSGNYEGAQVL